MSDHSSAVEVELPCGRLVSPDAVDMGLREHDCTCGSAHAVVMDVHPVSRWIPESVEAILQEVVVPDDEYDTFETIHLMGLVLEEFPDQVTVIDATENPSLGYAMAWITAFDARRLHEIVVDLLLELMDHAMTHAGDDEEVETFGSYLAEFDPETFVDQYRTERDFEDEQDAFR